MPNKIGVVLAVDKGEKFAADMRTASNTVKQLKSELTGLTSEYKGSANSMEYLSQKQANLTAQQKAYENVLDKAKAGRKNAVKANNDQKKALAELEQEYQKAKKAAEDYEKAGDTKNAEKAAKEADQLSNALKKQETNAAKAEENLSKWDVKVAKAQKDVTSSNKAVEENAKYLKEAENAADGCATSIDAFGKKAKSAGKEAKSFGQKVKDALIFKGTEIAVGAAHEAVQKTGEAVKYMVDVGSEFESSMSKVEALSGATTAQLSQMSDKAKELGSTTKFSASEVADGFSYMALAGWSTQQMLDSIDGVVNLAAASEMDLAEASDMVTDYLSAFGLSASEAGKMADQMAYAQANSNTSTTQLGEAFGNCAANMHAAGQDMETTTAVLEALANQGLKGSQAGTALAAVMRDMTSKMKDGKIAIGETEVTVQDANGNFRDLTDILKDVESATDGMGSAEKSAALSTTFTARSITAMNMALTEGSGKIESYEEALRTCDGSAATMAATMQNNLKGSLTELSSATEGLGIAAYEAFGGQMAGAVDIATSAVSALTDAITPQKTVLDEFLDDVTRSNEQVAASVEAAQQVINQSELDTAQLEAYKQILIETNGAADEFSQFQLQQIVEELSGSIPELAAAWDAESNSLNLTNTEIEKLIGNQEELARQNAMLEARTQAYAAQAQAEINLAKATSAEKKAIEEVNAAHGKNFETMAQVVEYYSQTGIAFDSAWKAAAKAADEVGNARTNLEEAKSVVETTNEALDSMSESMRDSSQTTSEAAEEHRKMKSAVQESGTAVQEQAEISEEAAAAQEEAAQKITEAHQNAAEEILGIYDAAKQAAESAFEVDPFEGWEQNQENGIEKMQEALESQIEGYQNYSDNLDIVRQNMAETAPDFLQNLESMGKDGAQLVQELAQAFESGDTSAAESLVEKYREALDIQDGISTAMAADSVALKTGLGQLGSTAREWDGLTDVVDKVIESGGQVSDATATQFAQAAAIAQECGVTIPEGLAEGIQSSDDPEAAVQNATAQLQSALQGQAEGLLTVARELGIQVDPAVAEGIASGGEAAAEAYRTLLSQLSGVESGVTREAQSGGEQIAEGTASGIEASASTAATAAEGMASEAAQSVQAKSAEFTTAGTEAAAQYASGIMSGQGTATAAGASIGQAAVSGAASASGGAQSIGYNISAGVARGIASGQSSTVNAAVNMVTAAIRAAQSAAGIHSPSTKFRDLVGKQISAGVAVGIKQRTKLTEDAATYQMDRTLAATQKWLTKNAKKIKKTGTSMSEAVEYTYGRLLDAELKRDFGISKTTTKTKKGKEVTTKKTAQQYNSEVYSAASTYMSNLKKLYDISDEAELAYWKKVRKNLKEGTQAWIDANGQVNSLKETVKKNSAEAARTSEETYEAASRKALAKTKSWTKQYKAEIKKSFGNKKTGQTAEEYYSSVYQSAETYMNNVKALHTVSSKQELTYWQGVRKKLKKGTEAWYEASKTIKELKEQIAEEAKRAEEEGYDRIVSTAEDYVSRQKSLNHMSIRAEIQYWQSIKKQLKEGTDQYQKVADTIAQLKTQIGSMTAATNLIDSFQTYREMSEKAEMQYWDTVRKLYAAGTEDRIAADQKYFDAKKAYTDKLTEIEEKYAEKIEETSERYSEAIDQRTEQIRSAFDIFDAFESRAASGEELLFNIQAQAAGYKEWVETLEELRDRGVLSEELLAELTEKGPQEIAALKALLTLTNEKLQQYQKAYDEKNRIANEQAQKENNSLGDTVKKEIKDLKAERAKETAEVNEEIDAGLLTLAQNLGEVSEDQTTALAAAIAGELVKAGVVNAAGSNTQSLIDNAKTAQQAQAAGSSAADAAKAAAEKAAKEKAAKEKAAAEKKVADAKAAVTKAEKAVKTAESNAAAKDKAVETAMANVASKEAAYYKLTDKQKNGKKGQSAMAAIQKAREKASTAEAAWQAALAALDKARADLKAKQATLKKVQSTNGYARGSRKLMQDGLIWMDEYLNTQGPEMIVRPSDNAILTRVSAGDSVVPANLASNLWKWGAIDPSAMNVASGNAMNLRLMEGIGTQMKVQNRSSEDILAALGTIISYMPEIAAGMNPTINGKILTNGIAGDMSRELAARARRRR